MKTGILDNKYIEITQGLKEGQEVVVKDGYLPLPAKVDAEQMTVVESK